VNRARIIRETPGGKGVNVAAALADFGHQTAATGFLGRENARLFEALFVQKRITDCFIRIAGETRMGIKVCDPVAQNTTDINFPGTAPSLDDIASLWKQLEALDAPWFVLGGSLPPKVDPAIYGNLVARLKAMGQKVILDTSEEPLRLALQAAPSIIKPNIHELEALLGEPLRNEQEVIHAARSLLSHGIEMVVVSMGKDGACFVTADQVVIATPPEIQVLSTVGAGDAMVAGIASAHLRDLSLADCARVATAFSIEAISQPEGGKISPAAIASAMERVTLRIHSH